MILPGQSILVLAGQVIDGAVLSFTAMVVLQVAVLPQSSVANHVRVLTTGQVPLETVLTTVMSTLWSKLSVAVGLGHTTVAGQLMVVLAAQVIVGGITSVLSKTTTESRMVQLVSKAAVI
jgi:hypothetical protein